jgi:hypothetical protein
MPKFKMALMVMTMLAVVGGTAWAQSATGKTVNAAPGKPVRLGIYPAMHKDCSPGPLPEVRIVQPPANGIFRVRRAKGKVNAPGRCPAGTEISVQIAIYQSNPNFVGNDIVTYEISAEGIKHSYTINVSVAPQSVPQKKPPNPNDI